MEGHLDESAARYRAVQRINRACYACRRKKSRCTGQRPSCALCRRTGQECLYPPTSRQPTGSSREAADYASPPSQSNEEVIASMAKRLRRMEDMMLNMSEQMKRMSSIHAVSLLKTPGSRTPQPLLSPSDQSTFSSRSLPPQAVLTDTVDVFFRFCHNQPYSFFHEANFRRQLEQGLLPEHLVLAVLASAVRFSANPYFSQPNKIAAIYANNSWKTIVASCLADNQAAHLQTIQTITLLAIFDFTAGRARHSAAWVKIGLSVRIAQDLKLMIENSASLPFEEREERRRVFWSVYLLDRLVSCGRWRPPAIIDASCQLQLPCNESNYRTGHWCTTISLPEFISRNPFPEGFLNSPLAHVIVVAHTVSRTAGYMLQQFDVRSCTPPWDTKSEFASIESDLLYLEGALLPSSNLRNVVKSYLSADGSVDQPSAGPRIFSMALFHLCYCLLYHPFLLRRQMASCCVGTPSSFLSRSFDSAWHHARDIIETLKQAHQCGVAVHASFYGYCLVVSGSIMALQYQVTEGWKKSESARLLADSIESVMDIGRYWESVMSIASSLQKFSDLSLTFPALASEHAEPLNLNEAEEELMWSLLDYSTMSNASNSDQEANANLEQWANIESSWFDMFGTMSAEALPSEINQAILPSFMRTTEAMDEEAQPTGSYAFP